MGSGNVSRSLLLSMCLLGCPLVPNPNLPDEDSNGVGDTTDDGAPGDGDGAPGDGDGEPGDGDGEPGDGDGAPGDGDGDGEPGDGDGDGEPGDGDGAPDNTTDWTDTDPGQTCADGVECLIACGSFSEVCINQCTADLPDDESSKLTDLQLCAIQTCFFLGLCILDDFHAPECVQCRLNVNGDPASFGCAAQGMACGI